MSTQNSLNLEVQPDTSRMDIFMRYYTFITDSSSSNPFIPLSEHLSPTDLDKVSLGDLGSISYLVNNKFKKSNGKHILHQDLSGLAFYPFTPFPQTNCPYLLGKGIADKILFHVAQDLQHRFEKDTRLIYHFPSDEHIFQLKRLGIKTGEYYSLTEFADTIKQNIEANQYV